MPKTKNKQENKVGAGHAPGGAHYAVRQRGKMDREKPLAAKLTATAWRVFDYGQKVVFDPAHVTPVCYLIILAELVLNYLIVENVPYTEIDWKAYMQEVEGFLNGTLDYSQLRGDTGPCVYPAGFLYVYSFFYYVTDRGHDVKLAQYMFILIYVAQTYLTHRVVTKTCKLPGYALVLSFLTSYRIHSIYVLRLFNDPIAVLLFWWALNSFIADRWKTGSLLFSLAVSVKMNILLYAPCLLLAYVANLSWTQTILNLFICGATQLVLGLPFLLTHPLSYLRASFDLGRVFEHKWTVNYRFLDVELFADARFHVALLVVHLSLLALFAPLIWKYFKAYDTLKRALGDMKRQTAERNGRDETKAAKGATNHERQKEKDAADDGPLTDEQRAFIDAFEKQIKAESKDRPAKAKRNKALQHKQSRARSARYALAPKAADEREAKVEVNFCRVTQLLVLPFFVANLIGIACARSLHYQFYSWYFHSLLYLAYSTPFGRPLALLLLGLLESAWNIYPSTAWSSATLHCVHVALLCGLYRTMKG